MQALNLCNDILGEIAKFVGLKFIVEYDLFELFTKQETYNHLSWKYAMEYNKFNMLEWLVKNTNSLPCQNSLEFVILSANTKLLRFLYKVNPNYFTIRTMEVASEFGIFKVVKWIHNNITPYQKTLRHNDSIDNAASNGHFELLKWLYKKGYEPVYCSLDKAAWRGDFKMMKWIYKNYPSCCTDDAMTVAAEKGNLKIIKWLIKYELEGSIKGSLYSAAKNGHLDVVKYLSNFIKNDICFNKYKFEKHIGKALNNAAKNGHLDVVKYLSIIVKNTIYINNAVNSAIENDHLEIVKYLHSKNVNVIILIKSIKHAEKKCHHEVVDWFNNLIRNPLTAC
jgi:hypothetical protein